MADLSREKALNEALALMHFGFRKMIEEPDRLLARRGFGRVHHRVLFFVARRPRLSVGELLAILDVSKQSLHRPMQELVAAALLAAEPDPENRRVKRLALTPAGEAYEDKLSGIQRRLFAEVFRARGTPAEQGWRAVMHELGEGQASEVMNGGAAAPRTFGERGARGA
jgi:DNA-binding MarR family transcriptional regulator